MKITRSYLLAACCILCFAGLARLEGADPSPTTDGPNPFITDPEVPNSQSRFAADRAAFPSISFPVDEQGAPRIQLIRLNAQPSGSNKHYSGFRFRVDRTEAAERQHVADKTKMHLFWFFVNPPGMVEWFIEPVEGRMYGFMNFFPLKMNAFQNVGVLLPKQGTSVVIQKLAADGLEDGREYIMWFRCNDNAAVPSLMSASLGYRLDDRDFKQWQDLTDIARFLGLVPAGGTVGFDQRSH